MSKFERMSQKYDVITPTTGYEIYHDDEFEIRSDYLDYYNDYNALIHREIKRENVNAVHSLCSWIYYCDRAFPWYDIMLELVLKDEEINIPTFLFVLYMRKFWYEERSESISFEQALEFANTPEKKEAVKTFLVPFEFDEEASDDDEKYDVHLRQERKLLKTKLFEYGVDIRALEGEFEEAKAKVRNFPWKRFVAECAAGVVN